VDEKRDGSGEAVPAVPNRYMGWRGAAGDQFLIGQAAKLPHLSEYQEQPTGLTAKGGCVSKHHL
jgi:hypothetical protein